MMLARILICTYLSFSLTFSPLLATVSYAQQACDEDTTFCDNGQLTHKHGGYWDDDEQKCVYAFDPVGPCPAAPQPTEAPPAVVEKQPQLAATQQAFENYSNSAPIAQTAAADVPQEPQPVATPTPRPEQPAAAQVPSGQVEEERQQALVEKPAPLPVPVEEFLQAAQLQPVVDATSQGVLLNQYGSVTETLANSNDQTLAQTRENQASEQAGPAQTVIEAAEAVRAAPAVVGDTLVDVGQAPVDLATNLAGAVSAFQEQREQADLAEQGAQLEAEVQKVEEAKQQAIEEVLSAPVEERAAEVAQALGLPGDTIPEELVKTVDRQFGESTGIEITGNLDNLTVTLASPEKTQQYTDDLAVDISLAQTPEDYERLKQLATQGLEALANLVSQDFYNVFKHTAEEQFKNLPELRTLGDRVGFSEEYITKNTREYLQQIRDLQKLTAEELEERVNGCLASLSADQAATCERLRVQKQYADAVGEQAQRMADLQQEAKITGALALAGGPLGDIAGAGLKRAGQLVEGRTGLLGRARELLSGILRKEAPKGERSGTKVSLQNGEPVYGMALQTPGSGMTGLRQEALLTSLVKDLNDYPPETVAKADEILARIPGLTADQQFIEREALIEFQRHKIAFPEEVDTAEKLLAAQEKVRQSVYDKFQGQEDLKRALMADWLSRGVPPEEISVVAMTADSYHKFIEDAVESGVRTGQHFREAIDNAPLDIQRAWHALRYDSRIETTVGSPVLSKIDIMDSLLTQEANARVVRDEILQSQRALVHLRDYAIANGAQDISFRHLNAVADEAAIHVISSADMNSLVSQDAVGVFFRGDKQIALRGEYARVRGVLSHECIHRACHLGLSDPELTVNALSEGLGGSHNYVKLVEGITEWTSRKGNQLAGQPSQNLAYIAQVDAIEEIIETLKRNGRMSRPQAEALVIEVAISGYYGKLYEPLGKKLLDPFGKGNIGRGRAVLVDILGRTPITTSNVIARARRESSGGVTPKDISVAIGGVGAAGASFYGIPKAREALDPALEPVRENIRQLLPFDLIKSVHAQSDSAAPDSQMKSYELLVKIRLVQNALGRENEVNSKYLSTVATANVSSFRILKIQGGFVFITGEEGVVNGNVPAGKYLLHTQGLRGVDVILPQSIEVNTEQLIIPVGIKEGLGEVKRSGYLKNSQTPFAVHAQEQDADKLNVKAVTYYDENKNGKWDGDEHSIPWAGVQVELKRVNQDKLVSLLPGWNLITLTAVPTKPLTASSLIGEIAKQEGYATTVATLENGAWKTYVQRGDKNFSGEDFPVVPGKAYFVKALKRSVFLYQGQEFVEPVKLKLAQGWNAVGMPKTGQSYDASKLLSNTAAAEADTAARWESGLWDTFVKKLVEEYGENFPIEPNRGYIIRVGRQSEFIP